MALRTSAALALVTALLASPVAAFACGFECSPAPLQVAAVRVVEASPAEGSCHRQTEEHVAGNVTFSAARHDCSTHSPLVPRLRHPKTAAPSTPSTNVTLWSAASRLVMSALGAGLTTSPTDDLSPPGRTPELIIPLRI